MPSWISTPGHGYLKITLNQLMGAIESGLVLTGYSAMNGTHAFLEEDVDAGRYLDHMRIARDRARGWRDSYRKTNLDFGKSGYVTVPSSQETLRNIDVLMDWMRVVQDRKDLRVGDVVELDNYPSKIWSVIERMKTRRKLQYYLKHSPTGEQGWAASRRITRIL